jgi:aryl-alcohol dehydrogenase-like predicted oxidoreductase
VSWLRPLGNTGLKVSAIGLGTVKLGRNREVKYPGNFALPDDRSAADLLAHARELGINLIDTAPAYGSSEERLGKLLAGQRQHWLICTKVGEEFQQGKSHFDFSPQHIRSSVQRSLRRLNTDVIDILLIHSDGSDLQIINQTDSLDELAQLKNEGLIRSYGMSTKTVEGGLAAAHRCDVVMLTYNPLQREELPVLECCKKMHCGALVKKPLASGHLVTNNSNAADPVQSSMDLVLGHPGTTAAIVGTITPAHLFANVAAARRAINRPGESC